MILWYKMTYRLLPLSDSLIYTENTFYQKNKVLVHGFKAILSNLKTPHTLVNNGFDLLKWYLSNNKQKRFIAVISESQFKLNEGLNLSILVQKMLMFSKLNHITMKVFKCEYFKSNISIKVFNNQILFFIFSRNCSLLILKYVHSFQYHIYEIVF